MTNTFFIVTVVLTNWVNNGDYKHEMGTNFVKQAQVVSTNVYLEMIVVTTNRTLLKQDWRTNGVSWVPVTTTPGTPGRL